MENLVALVVPRPRPRAALVLLHGLYGGEHDFESAVATLDPAGRLLTVLVRGAYAADGNAWFYFGDPERVARTLVPTLNALARTLERELVPHGLSPGDAIVGGFSQGGSTALAYGLAATTRFRPLGVFAMGGVLPLTDRLTYDWTGAPRVSIQRGTHDDDTPVAEARRLAVELDAHGVRVRFREHAAGHEVTPAMLVDAAEWLATVTQR